MDKRKFQQTNGMDENSESEGTEEGDSEDEDWQEGNCNKSDLPSEYWHALKLIKYIKVIIYSQNYFFSFDLIYLFQIFNKNMSTWFSFFVFFTRCFGNIKLLNNTQMSN